MMKTPLIAGNSFEKGQSAAKTLMSKVQRLAEKRTSKWVEMGSNQKWLKI